MLTLAACGQAPEVATDWPLGMPTKLSAPVRASPFSSAPLSPFGPAPPSPQQRSGGDGSGGGGAASGAKGREGEAGASAAIPIPEGGGEGGGKVLPSLGALWVVHDMHVLDSASCPINARAKIVWVLTSRLCCTPVAWGSGQLAKQVLPLTLRSSTCCQWREFLKVAEVGSWRNKHYKRQKKIAILLVIFGL